MSIATPPGTDDGPAVTCPPNAVVSCSQGNSVPTAATAPPANRSHDVRDIGSRTPTGAIAGVGVEVGVASTGGAVAGASISGSIRSTHPAPSQTRSPIHWVPVQKRIVCSLPGSGYQPRSEVIMSHPFVVRADAISTRQ